MSGHRKCKELYTFHPLNGITYYCYKCGVKIEEGESVVAKGMRRKGGLGLLHSKCYVDAKGRPIYS